MSYATSRLQCIMRGGDINWWLLDTVDTIATVNTAGFISDASQPAAGAKGMLKGDRVTVRIWTTTIPAATSELRSAADAANILTAMHECWVIGISAAGAADLTDGLAVTATNTD